MGLAKAGSTVEILAGLQILNIHYLGGKMEQTMDQTPKLLGKTDIPSSYSKTGPNKAQYCREMLNRLTPGRADVYEFIDKKEALDYRSVLYTMAIFRFGQAGKIATRVIDNLFYVWLVENDK